MNEFQKLFCMVDEHEKTKVDFNNFFGLGHFLTHHPSLIKWPNWRGDPPSRRHSFLESTGQGQWKSGTKAGLGLWTFLLEAKMSSDEARTLEFWNAVLRVSRALPKVKNSSYGLFWVFNEKSAKAMIFWKWRPVGSLHNHTKWPKKDVSGWNFQKPIIYS